MLAIKGVLQLKKARIEKGQIRRRREIINEAGGNEKGRGKTTNSFWVSDNPTNFYPALLSKSCQFAVVQ